MSDSPSTHAKAHHETRVALRSLRATLLAWGTPSESVSLRWFDAWGRWLLTLHGDRGGQPPRPTEPPPVAFESMEAALHCVLALSIAGAAHLGGLDGGEREAAWAQLRAGEALVRAALERTTRRRSTTSTSTSATTSQTTARAPTAAKEKGR